VIGDETDVEGKVNYSGIVRFSKDSQRQYNYWATAETEMVALAPKAPWIVEEGQIEGYEDTWRNANVKNNPYLQYKATSINGTLAPPPQRQAFAGVPQGIVNAKEAAARDMMATTGIRFDASPNERMHDESGRAIRELRRSGDLGSSHYVDNLGRSLKHLGRMMIEILPKVYDEPRQVMLLREDGGDELVHIDPHADKPYEEIKGPDGHIKRVFNPTVGRYGVSVEVGPSYATKRIEASESMMDFARALPQSAALIMDLIAKYQDWPGAEEMAARLAKALPPNLTAPDQKDVSPQAAAMIAGLQQQVQASNAELQKAMAALVDKDKDREIAREKINADFEAKVLGIMQKAESDMNRQVGEKVEGLVAGVQQLMDLYKANAAAPAETTPPAAQAGSPDGGMSNA
jgi:hypothetical protein